MDLALTADLGNSRLKLCAWDTARFTVSARATFPSETGVGRAAADFARAHGPFRGAALSSVAAKDLEAEVLDALDAVVAGGCALAPESALAIDVREPERVGRDRLYAARGALEHRRAEGGARVSDDAADAGLIVVDAGTALTVDAVDARGAGRFLGGAIAPGPALLARALAEHTARLPRVDPAAHAVALGRDTESAVQAGVVVGFRGAALELALRIAAEAGFRAPLLVLTGGASPFLTSTFDRPEFARVVLDLDLVHRGLLADWVSSRTRGTST